MGSDRGRFLVARGGLGPGVIRHSAKSGGRPRRRTPSAGKACEDRRTCPRSQSPGTPIFDRPTGRLAELRTRASNGASGALRGSWTSVRQTGPARRLVWGRSRCRCRSFHAGPDGKKGDKRFLLCLCRHERGGFFVFYLTVRDDAGRLRCRAGREARPRGERDKHRTSIRAGMRAASRGGRKLKLKREQGPRP